MRVFNEKILNGSILNAAVTSAAIPLKSIFMYSIGVVVAGTPTGVLKLQVSNDPETNDSIPLPPPTNWYDLANSSNTLSAAGNTFYNISDVAYNYVRIVYTDGSGGTSTATMSAIINAKGI